MAKKDYSLKFYTGKMINENDEEFDFYLAARSETEAYNFIQNYVMRNSNKYHLIPNENGISEIKIHEVPMADYGKRYGYTIIN